MTTFYLCPHSRQRAAQRGLTEEELEYVLLFGTRIRKNGALTVFLRAKDLPEGDRRRPFCSRLVGTAVVLDPSGRAVLTVWRNRRSGLKHIRTKPAWRSESWESGWDGIE
jgi:hypothetical protein